MADPPAALASGLSPAVAALAARLYDALAAPAVLEARPLLWTEAFASESQHPAREVLEAGGASAPLYVVAEARGLAALVAEALAWVDDETVLPDDRARWTAAQDAATRRALASPHGAVRRLATRLAFFGPYEAVPAGGAGADPYLAPLAALGLADRVRWAFTSDPWHHADAFAVVAR